MDHDSFKLEKKESLKQHQDSFKNYHV